jgi:ABC-type multidrug transport system ATPase subunit/pSer/pThr/pTyr-binding forkhead associated (FHA) protein
MVADKAGAEGTMGIMSGLECYPAVYEPGSETLLPLGANGRSLLVGWSDQADLIVPGCDHQAREHLCIKFTDHKWMLFTAAAGPAVIVNNREIGSNGKSLSHGDVIASGPIMVLFLTRPPAFSRPEATVFPAFYLPLRDTLVPLTTSRSLVLGRHPDTDISFPNDETCSRTQVRIDVRRASPTGRDAPPLVAIAEPLSEKVPTFLNKAPLRDSQPLKHGDILSFGASVVVYLERRAAAKHRASATDDDRTRLATHAGTAPASDPGEGTMMMTPAFAADTVAPIRKDIVITGRMRVGRDAHCEIVLDHPTISRLHAELAVNKGRVFIRDRNSRNGTFVNDTKIDTVVLEAGDRIDIGPFQLAFSGDRLTPLSRATNARVVARSLSHTVMTADGPRELLHDISLVIEKGDFVCILGPSGCGKTTLMNALSGRVMASEGSVWINDTNLYQHFDLLKGDIAHVPQHDVLHEDISLSRALDFTARLRLSPDATRGQRNTDVAATIDTVDLGEVSQNPIKRYSGGQKKRASLANETLCRPNLLFLDEVTSGLDEKTDEEMMQLCRQMADNGKIIICITHTLANVEQYCTKLIVLQKGGYLAFYGHPDEARAFFGVDRLGGLYRKLEQVPADEAERRYRASEPYRRHIATPLKKDELSAQAGLRAVPPKTGRGGFQWLGDISRQLTILTERSALLMAADWKSLAIALGQAFVIGLLLKIVFASGAAGLEANLVFLMSICALWFGCNNAAKEIVKERPIYQRERDINLGIFPYVTSKLVVYGLLAVTQILILTGVVAVLIGIPGNNALQVGMLALTALVGTAMGLCISASVVTRDQATTLVPLALIPQIVLAGVIVPHMPDFADQVARATVSGYWAFKGMSSVLFPTADTKTYVSAFQVLSLHAVLFFVAACLVMVRRDRRG